ncbi:hypothetical protein [Streptomyces sp. NPDC056069]|uniref:hypothetical protein n=1 Tax=Streptomyces sp. NPDC056069 TaxID=3345702 RepID=UPI0035D6CDC3
MTTRDLHPRYMRATTALREHDAQCTTCTPAARCPEGARLYESFSRLQDAYLNHNRNGR